MEDKIIFKITNSLYWKDINVGINLCMENKSKCDGILEYREFYILLSLIFVQIAIGFKTKEKWLKE